MTDTLAAADIETRLNALGVKGFLPANEAAVLYRLALQQAPAGTMLEIGSYCGRSAVYLGEAARTCGAFLFSVDHHQGSEEHQPGQDYFDPQLWDAELGYPDSLRYFRRTLAHFDLLSRVFPLVARSEHLALAWHQPLALVFMDGGHSADQALQDVALWGPKVGPAGIFIMHDIFEHPEQGGQAPYIAMQALMAKQGFCVCEREGSLVALRRMS